MGLRPFLGRRSQLPPNEVADEKPNETFKIPLGSINEINWPYIANDSNLG